ncbi:MAG: PIN domain-containing protein [bacterium]
MKKYLVDTDIFIDFFKKKPWAKKVFAARSHEIYFSSVTLKELLRGAQSGADEKRILKFLHFHTELRITSEIGEKSLMLLRKYPRLKRSDSLIAACAIVKRLPLVTRNLKDFSSIKELKVIDGKSFEGE